MFSKDHDHARNENLCMFGLAACDKGGPGFVNANVTITNARRVAVRLRSKCTSTHRHAQTNENNTIEKGEQTGIWVRPVAGEMEEQLRGDKERLKTHPQKRKTEDAKRIRGIIHDDNKNNILKQRRMARSGAVRQGETRGSGVHPSPQDVHKSLQEIVPT